MSHSSVHVHCSPYLYGRSHNNSGCMPGAHGAHPLQFVLVLSFCCKHLCTLPFPLALISTESTGLEKVFLVKLHGKPILGEKVRFYYC